MRAIVVLFSNHVSNTALLLSKGRQTIQIAIVEPNYCHLPKPKQQELGKTEAQNLLSARFSKIVQPFYHKTGGGFLQKSSKLFNRFITPQ